MPVYFGNTLDKIDWSTIIDNIKHTEGFYDISRPNDPITESALREKIVNSTTEYFKTTQHKDAEYQKFLEHQAWLVLNGWLDAGYNYKQIYWENFHTGKEIDIAIETEFAKIVNAVPLRTFITRIVPGVIAPWHYDVLPDYSDHKNLVRYICFIHDPVPGQTISFQDKTFYNETKGTIFKWDDTKQWHAAANASLVPYYLYHFEGYEA